MRDPLVKPYFGQELDLEHIHHFGITGCWVFNDGSGRQAWDNGPNRIHAIHEAFFGGNFPSWASGKHGHSVLYEGSEAYSRIPYNSLFDTSTALSLEVWFRPIVNLDPVGIFGRGDFGAGSGTYGLIHNPGAAPTFRVGGTSVQATTTLVDNLTWYHLVGVWDGADLRIYLQGKEEASAAKASFSTSGTDDLFIATDINQTIFLNAFVQHARIWVGRALSAEVVQDLFFAPYAGWLPSLAERLYLIEPFSNSSTTTQTVQAKAAIRATTTRTVQAKAAIRSTPEQTVQAKARLLPENTKQVQALGQICEPETDADATVDSWEVSDEFGALARQFTVSAQDVINLQPGNQVRIKAGYDNRNVLLIDGRIDETSQAFTVDDEKVTATGRDNGADELITPRITRTWTSIPEKTMPRAHQVIREAAEIVGIGIGVLEFPDYDLFASYTAIGETIPDIVAKLVEPWNQFERIQYVTQIRDKTLSVIKVDWTAPQAGGYQIGRRQHSSQTRRQVLYLAQPRLNEVDRIIIRGASWTTPKLDLGTQVRIEYFRNVTTEEVDRSLRGQVPVAGEDVPKNAPGTAYTEQVVTETTIIETIYGDKVLSRLETIIINDDLSSRTQERYWYFEPGTVFNHNIILGDVDTFLIQSASPSENALLFMIHTRREGYVEVGTGGTLFQEVFREITEYNYDNDGNVACEHKSTQEFLEEEGRWDVARNTTRIHSQTTGGSVRTTLLNFIFEDSKFKIASADTQQVGGVRPRLNDGPSRQSLITHQAQAPQGELDADGEPIDFGEGFFTWQYENEFIGQDVCDAVYQLALDEKAFQLQGFRWEEIQMEGILNPNIWVGQSVSVEISESVHKDYRVQSVAHRFDANQAMTSGMAKRLTREELT